MTTEFVTGIGIGIPRNVPIIEINRNGDLVDTGDTLHVLWCHDCLFGSPKNCPRGIFNLCHPEIKNIKLDH